MDPTEFLTVPEELLSAAAATAGYFGDLGYRVTREARELGYPFTPTLRCKRQSTTCFVEVDIRPPFERLREWVAYGRSCRSDTRVLVAIPDTADLSAKHGVQLKELGVGLLIVSASGVKEAMPAQDLAVNVSLPDTKGLSARLRGILGPVNEHFERNQWREGFEEACVALETAARAYLWKTIKSGRTQVLTPKGKPKSLDQAAIDGMTMGTLAATFRNLQQQNHSDTIIADTLKSLNKDRIRVAHKKRTSAAERALRQNVGQQMWRIVGALKEIYKA